MLKVKGLPYRVTYHVNNAGRSRDLQDLYFKTLGDARKWMKSGVKDGSYNRDSIKCYHDGEDVTAWFFEKF
jgi:hypothetical protein